MRMLPAFAVVALLAAACRAGEGEAPAEPRPSIPLKERGSPPTGSSSLAPRELVTQGNQYFAGGDYDGAIGRWGRAQRDRPNSPEIDLNLGLAHLRKGEDDRASAYFIAAAAKGGGRLASNANFNLGAARVRQGRFDDAIEAYEDSLRADPGNEDARHNLLLVQRHFALLKELEEKRKKAEEEFRKRLEALLKELRELVERQAEVVAVTWATEPGAEGPLPNDEDVKALKALAGGGKPLPDDLAAKLARALVRARDIEPKRSTARLLAQTERLLSGRARKAAEAAALLAADLRGASGQAKAAPHPPQGTERPPENPLVGKLERAGGALEEGGSKLGEAARILAGRPRGVSEAEPAEVLGLWKLLKALGELASPPQSEHGGTSEEMKKALARMAEIRRRQAALVRDVWASFPGSRGTLPDAGEQKAFWDEVRAGGEPTEEERAKLSRVEILGGRRTGDSQGARALAEAQASLAEDARGLAAEVEAMAAKAGGGGESLGALVETLRGAAEAMDAAAGKLGSHPAATGEAEAAAVLAFVRLSRAPTQLDELMGRLGQILSGQMQRLLDTWKSDPAARGPVATPEEMKAADEATGGATAGATGDEGGLDPELEAKLGRLVPDMIEKRSGASAGDSRSGAEAAGLQREVADRAKEAAVDMRKLAARGRPGEMNPAAPMLEGAAVDVEAAAALMEEAAGSLPDSFSEAEPSQARAVASLMRAMARFASGAAEQSGEKGDEQQQDRREKDRQEKDAGKKPGEEELGAQSDKDDSTAEDRRKGKKGEPMSKERAKRMLDEAAQLERDVRRDMRKRRGGRSVEVEKDW